MLPNDFKERMKQLLGDEYDSFISAEESTPQKAIRVNTGKISAESFFSSFPFEHEKIPYCTDGYYVKTDADDKLGNLPLHHAGAFYVQEPSAMMPVCAAEIKEDSLVLDMCASPGGKTSQAASVKGVTVVSNEIVSSRAVVLMGNNERMGFKNTIVTNTDSKTIAEWFPGVFDTVICDAPCSGEGMFRKNPDACDEWSYENVLMCASRQEEILDNAAKAVRGGGTLVYSTCTFSKEENEDVVKKFLEKHGDFELIAVSDAVRNATSDGIEMAEARRFYPHKSRGEGQFAAVFKRNGEPCPVFSYKDAAIQPTKAEMKTISDFLGDIFDEVPSGRIIKIGNTFFLSPDIPIPPRSVFCAGVKIGEIEKNRLVPHHQLFSAYGNIMKRRLNLSSSSLDIKKYIGGNVIPADLPNGYAAVLCDGCALGGGKVVDGTMKNHYPKGLRKNLT